ncbi:DUF3331 domain-containing protein [Paraburkholderia sediminicola]|uniref:DUF3331 domain-containing protein n=1 Tax=Paraburkholderia sediminicola TaxID=458836 RepID=UPI0038B6DEA8
MSSKQRQMARQDVSRWRQTVDQLMKLTAPRRTGKSVVGAVAVARRTAAPAGTRHYAIEEVHVTVLDRPTSLTAIIAWRDPTECRYGEQRWRGGVARGRGTCALTGRTIKRGDAIYRPQRRVPPPANAGAMILSEAVQAIPRMR